MPFSCSQIIFTPDWLSSSLMHIVGVISRMEGDKEANLNTGSVRLLKKNLQEATGMIYSNTGGER